MVTSTGDAGSAEGTLRNDDLPAAFWDAYPENPDNADLQAINALLEESTPEERAETYKVRRPVYASVEILILDIGQTQACNPCLLWLLGTR